MTKTKHVQGIVYRINANNRYEFLALKRTEIKGGFWQAVGGGVEDSDEDLDSAIKRELKEEISLQNRNIVTVNKGVHSFIINKHYLTKKPLNTSIIEYVYGIEVDNDFVPNIENNHCNEHTEFKWLGFKDMLAILKWEDNKTGLRKLKDIIIKGEIKNGN